MPRHSRWLALALLLWGTASVRADSSADEAETRFRRGAQLYRQGKYDEALLEFFTSNRLAPNKNVVFNIARSFEALGRYDEAYRYYGEYRSAEADEPERAAIDGKLKELGPRVALVRVVSQPPGATVYVDRKDLGGHGETPLVVALPPGDHEILIERAGHEPGRTRVTSVRGQEVEAAVTLEPIVGWLSITTTATADVRVDRTDDDEAPPDGATPTRLRLVPGRHSIELRAAGHRPARRFVVVAEREEGRLVVILEPLPVPTATVAVAGGARGATVRVDEAAVGFVPLVVAVPVGKHVLRVSQEGYDDWTMAIEAGAGANLFFEPQLRLHEAEIVGATRSAQRVGDAPASVSVIDGDEVRAFGYETLSEALRGVRGLYASDDRNYQAVGIRGFSRPGDYTNRVLILRDGHAWNDDIVGSGFVGRDFAPDLEDVERIEVVRGAGSVFYGQGAFFGVVNVVTKPPGEGPALVAGGSILSDGGSRAFVHGHTTLGGARVALGASAYGSSGQMLYFDEFKDQPSGGVARDSDGEEAQRVWLRVQGAGLSLDATWNRRSKDIPTASYGTVFDPVHTPGLGTPEQSIDQRGYVEGRFERTFGAASVLVRFAADHADYRGLYPYRTSDNNQLFVNHDDGDGDSLSGEARVGLTLPGQVITLGVAAARHTIGLHVADELGLSRFDTSDTVNTVSGYAIDEIVASDRARFNVGVRVDTYGPTGDIAASPRAAAVLVPYHDGRTKLVAGHGYRAPSFYEQYYWDNGVSQLRAAPLAAETIDTLEIEHRHFIGNRAQLLASVYLSRIQGLIQLSPDPATGLLVYRNAAEPADVAGGELEARTTFASGAWLSAAVSTSWLSADVSTGTNSTPVVAAVRALVPLTTDSALAAEVIYNAPRQRRDGETTEHMLLANVTVSGQLLGRRLRWHASVTNLLDWRYSVAVGDEFVPLAITQDGRRFIAGVAFQY